MLVLLASRVDVYRLLRDAFTYPLTEDVITRLGSLKPDPDAAPALQHAIRTLQGLLSGSLQGADLVEHLNQEHSRLMSGPGMPPAPPYGSYYRSRDQRLFGVETAAVRQAYRQSGLVPANEGMPADHIALELEFMAALADLTLKAAAQGFVGDAARLLTNQHRFLRDRLRPFGRDLADRLSESTTDPFFCGLAAVLDQYLVLDLDLMERAEAV